MRRRPVEKRVETWITFADTSIQRAQSRAKNLIGLLNYGLCVEHFDYPFEFWCTFLFVFVRFLKRGDGFLDLQIMDLLDWDEIRRNIKM